MIELLGDPRLSAKFWSRVTPQPDGCWHWTGSVGDDGYGKFSISRSPVSRREQAHRTIYRALIGGIPDGFTIDHACHDNTCGKVGRECPHRRCLNPDHLRVMGRGQNAARRYLEGDRCPSGHRYDHVIGATGHRVCTTCRRGNAARSKMRRRYGIELEEYDQLRDAQEGRCAACGRHEGAIPLPGGRGRPRKDGSAPGPVHRFVVTRSAGALQLTCRECARLLAEA